MQQKSPDGYFPGRKDLRISLTTKCDYRCAHCHAEGNNKPWDQGVCATPTIAEIEQLIEETARRGAKSVRFTGGEPAVYVHILDLLSRTQEWALAYPTITCWGINTNGAALVKNKKLRGVLLESALQDLVIGLDSVRPDQKSKLDTPIGVSGQALLRDLNPLTQEWLTTPWRRLKFNVVYVGQWDETRVREVIEAALRLGAEVGIIELIGSRSSTLRYEFEAFRTTEAARLGLEAQYREVVDQTHLTDWRGRDVVRFYQDHCHDMVIDSAGQRIGCNACRRIHLRVGPIADGLGAIPCPFENPRKMIPITHGGTLVPGSVEDALHLNGRGPSWAIGTKYE